MAITIARVSRLSAINSQSLRGCPLYMYDRFISNIVFKEVDLKTVNYDTNHHTGRTLAITGRSRSSELERSFTPSVFFGGHEI